MRRKYCLPVCSIVILAWLAAHMAGCNTVKGVGKDITGAAESTERWLNGDSGGNSSNSTVYANHGPRQY